jgi:hypothetical protein
MHTDSRSGTSWRAAVAMSTIAALLLALAAPAQAKIIERDTYAFSGTDEIEEDLCGFPILVDWRWDGRYHIREGKAQETATPFFLQNRGSGYEVLTGNGTFITVRTEQVFKEITATYLGDARFEFTDMTAGSTTVRDAAGRLLARNSGNVWVTYVFDKSSSPRAPGGEFVELVDIRINGPRQWDEMSDEEFCALFGATS